MASTFHRRFRMGTFLFWMIFIRRSLVSISAVYDDEIFTKVKMAVVCTLFIHELDVGTYLKNEHHFNLNDQIQICYQFSRELEHSDLNLNKFQELMSENNIFSFENLLKIC